MQKLTDDYVEQNRSAIAEILAARVKARAVACEAASPKFLRQRLAAEGFVELPGNPDHFVCEAVDAADELARPLELFVAIGKNAYCVRAEQVEKHLAG